MRRLETDLTTLVDRTSPGDVRLGIPRYAWVREHASYEVSIQTRGCENAFGGKTLGDAIRSALYSLDNAPEGDIDPIVPSWYRVSRMQRQIVEQTLRRHQAKHMARAASANIAHSATAQAEYAIADAFAAALDILNYEEVDDHLAPLAREPLQARSEGSPVVSKNVEIERSGPHAPPRNSAAVSKAVGELRAKNRERAQAARKARQAPTLSDNREPRPGGSLGK